MDSQAGRRRFLTATFTRPENSLYHHYEYNGALIPADQPTHPPAVDPFSEPSLELNENMEFASWSLRLLDFFTMPTSRFQVLYLFSLTWRAPVRVPVPASFARSFTFHQSSSVSVNFSQDSLLRSRRNRHHVSSNGLG
jgi:hypothetical protein